MASNINSSFLSRSRLNATTLEGTNNDRMQKLAEKLGRITNVIQSENLINLINMNKNR